MVKQFLKIAKQCREAQNYNSMFAITSGLNHTAVSRLKQVSQLKSWSKTKTRCHNFIFSCLLITT